MKGPFAFWAIALSVGLAGVPALQSDITPVNYPTPLTVGSSVAGVITNIDPVNKMIQVREPSGMVQTIHVNEHIQILRNAQPVNFNTLTLGDSVTVTAQ